MWGCGDVDGMFNDGHDISCPYEGFVDGHGWRGEYGYVGSAGCEYDRVVGDFCVTELARVAIKELIQDAQSGFASGKKDQNGIAQIRMNNVTTSGNLLFERIRRVPKDAVTSLDKYILSEGDVLFNATNSPNLVGKTTRFVTQNEPYVFSNHFIRLIADSNKLDNRYLARWLTRQQQQGVFELLCKRWVNQASVRKDDLLALKIPLPPLAEQKRIAAILDKADMLRTKRRAALAKLDSLVQSVFLEMFGDPGTNPMGWEVKMLSKAFKIKPQIGTAKPAHFDGKQVVVRVGELGGDKIALQKCGTVTLLGKDLEKYSLEVDDFLLARAIGSENHLGKASILHSIAHPVVYDSHVMRLRFEQEILLPYFFLIWMKTKGGRARFMRRAGRTAVQFNINAKQIGRVEIPLPPIDLQQQFNSIYQSITEKQKVHAKHLNESDNLFHALQQRAFRGEL